MKSTFKTRFPKRTRRGQALVEYALIVAGVALIGSVSVSVFGHKVNDLMAAMATVLPCAHTDDNAPIQSGKIIETTQDGDGDLVVDAAGIAANSGTGRLDANVLGADGTTDGFGGLISE